jgi:hypothetical protein
MRYRTWLPRGVSVSSITGGFEGRGRSPGIEPREDERDDERNKDERGKNERGKAAAR